MGLFPITSRKRTARIVSAVIAGALLAGCAAESDEFETADDAVSAGTYKRIEIRVSKKCVDVNGNGTTNGTKIQQWECNATSAQAFGVETVGTDRYRIINPNSKKCVDVNANGSADRTKIQLWDCNGSAAQIFRAEDAGGGYERIVHVSSGKCLDIPGSNTGNGMQLQLWTCNGTSAQAFKFMEPSGSSGGTGGSGGTSGSGGSSGSAGSSGTGGASGSSGSAGSSGTGYPIPDNAYCAPVKSWQADWQSFEGRVLTLVNERRAAGAVCGSQSFGSAGPLTMQPSLHCAARVHSKDQVDRDYFSHSTKDTNEGPGDRIKKAGLDSWSGENIAAGYGSPEAVVEGWMKSPGHCSNIMNASSKETGVGYYPGGKWGHMWTQTFDR